MLTFEQTYEHLFIRSLYTKRNGLSIGERKFFVIWKRKIKLDKRIKQVYNCICEQTVWQRGEIHEESPGITGQGSC